MDRQFYLNHIDAVRDTIERLPEGARICNIRDQFYNGASRMLIQIVGSSESAGPLIPDRVNRSCAGFLWAEQDYDSVTVCWIVPEDDDEEDDDESAV